MGYKLNIKRFASLALTLGLVIPMLYPSEVKALEENKKITILHTNDIHGRFVRDNNSIGMDILATIKKENPNSVLLDAGDTTHGLPFVTLSKGQDAIDLMNDVGYDFMVPGNHDFNYGYERLLEIIKNSKLKNSKNSMRVSSSNVKKDGKSIFEPSMIKVVNGVKVGFFGLTATETAYKTNPNNVKGIEFENPINIAKEEVQKLKKEGAEIIVGVTHIGVDKSSTPTTYDIVNNVDGIDLIVDGHSHTDLPKGEKVKNTLIVSTGEHMQKIGKVELELQKHNGEYSIVKSNVSQITKDNAKDITPDKQVENRIKEIKDSQDKILQTKVGSTNVHLDGERADVRTRETNLGNLLTDAMIYETGADVAITNGGGIRSSIDKGDITKGDIIKVLPFGNYIETKELTGSQIKKVLEHGVKDYGNPAGSFAHISGVKVVVDPKKEVGNRIIDITIDNKKIDLNKKYTVATNDFMAVGGDDYPVFKDAKSLKTYSGLDEVLIKYIEKIGMVDSKVDKRITSTIEKLVGNDRFETATKVSNRGFEGAENVVIVNSNAIADSLSATPFAKLKNAPILLTHENKLDEKTKTEIKALGAKNAYIIGGEKVVGDNVVNELKDMKLNTKRISGNNRYETSLEIAKNLGDINEVAIVNGLNGLSDAVSIAPVAANKNMPILLSSPSDGIKIFDEFIKKHKIEKSYIIGGVQVVSNEIENKLPNSTRIGEDNRADTNAMIIEKFYKDSNLENIFIAKDGLKKETDLIDALSVGVVASNENVPVLIANENLSERQKQVLLKKNIKSLTQVGGNGNEKIVNEVSNMIKR